MTADGMYSEKALAQIKVLEDAYLAARERNTARAIFLSETVVIAVRDIKVADRLRTGDGPTAGDIEWLLGRLEDVK